MNQASEKIIADDKQFEELLAAIKTSAFDKVKQLLTKYQNDVLSRLELNFRQPALYFAVLNGNDNNSNEMVKLLVQFGADPKFKDQNDQTVIFYACREGKLKTTQCLLQKGLVLNQQDMYGQTPLFYVASQNRLNLLPLFNQKELINHSDKLASQTALFYSARKGYLEMSKALVQKGANPGHVDSQNKTAGDYAKRGKFPQVAQFLNNQVKKIKEANYKPMSSSIKEQSSANQKKKAKSKDIPQVPVQRSTYKIVHMNEKGEARDLTQQEVRNLIKGNEQLQTYLADPSKIPLQDIEASQNVQTWQKSANKVLHQVSKQKGAHWFAQPVDPVRFNIMDYFDIIEKPMDLSTVKKKLSHNVYRNAKHFCQDMNLIWSNCYKYNGDGHQISRSAKEVQAYFNQQVKSSGLEKYLRQ